MPRILALFLTLAIGLPAGPAAHPNSPIVLSPVHPEPVEGSKDEGERQPRGNTLRVTQEGIGLEELHRALAPTGVQPSAGLEEQAGPLSAGKADALMVRFLDSMKAGLKENGGCQDKAILDFRGMPEKKIIFVGDMHGYGGILERALERENLEDQNTILVVMGDAVHEEEQKNWAQMDSSILLIQRVMELKVKYPTRVYYLLGNHDRPTLTIQRSRERGGKSFKIGQYYFDRMRELYGSAYVDRYEEFLKESPLLVIADGFVSVHAGPVSGATLEQIRDADVASLLRPPSDMDPIVSQAVDGGDYNINSVSEFLRNVGLSPNAQILTSHFHLPTTWWHRLLLDYTKDPAWVNTVHNIYAGARSHMGRWGYARYHAGTLELVKHLDGQLQEIERFPTTNTITAGGLEESESLARVYKQDLARNLLIQIRQAQRNNALSFEEDKGESWEDHWVFAGDVPVLHLHIGTIPQAADGRPLSYERNGLLVVPEVKDGRIMGIRNILVERGFSLQAKGGENLYADLREILAGYPNETEFFFKEMERFLEKSGAHVHDSFAEVVRDRERSSGSTLLVNDKPGWERLFSQRGEGYRYPERLRELQGQELLELLPSPAAGLEEPGMEPDPEEVQPGLNEVQGLQRRGMLPAALKKLDEALIINPANPEILTAKGHLLVRMHRSEEALGITEQALKLDPNNVPAYTVRARAFNSLDLHEEALKITEQALKLDPNNVPTYLVRARAFDGLGRSKEAEETLRSALAIHPEDHHIHFAFGVHYQDQKEWEKARCAFEEVVRLNPGNSRAQIFARRPPEPKGYPMKRIWLGSGVGPGVAPLGSEGVLETEAISLEAFDAGQLRPGMAKEAGVLLVNFAEYVKGLKGKRLGYAGRVKTFFPSNVPSLKIIAFYQVPPGDLQLIFQRWYQERQKFKDCLLFALPEDFQPPDQSLVKVVFKMQGSPSGATLAFASSKTGLEEKELKKGLTRRQFLGASAAGGDVLSKGLASVTAQAAGLGITPGELQSTPHLLDLLRIFAGVSGGQVEEVMNGREVGPWEVAEMRRDLMATLSQPGTNPNLKRFFSEAEAAFRGWVSGNHANKPAGDPLAMEEAEQLLVAFDDPAHLDLFGRVRDFVDAFRSGFGSGTLTTFEEFRRAKQARLTAKDYFRDAVDRYAETRTASAAQEVASRLKKLGFPVSDQDANRVSEGFLKRFGQSVGGLNRKKGLPLDEYLKEWEMTERRYHWLDVTQSVRERLEKEFGLDFIRDVEFNVDLPDWRNATIPLEGLVPKYEQLVKEESQRQRLHRLLWEMADRRKVQGAEISKEALEHEQGRINGLSPGQLDRLDPEIYLKEIDNRYPFDIQEVLQKALSTRRLPSPRIDGQALAGWTAWLARASLHGPVDLWIHTGSDGGLHSVHWKGAGRPERKPFLSLEEMARLESTERWLSKVPPGRRYHFKIPQGTSDLTLAVFLKGEDWWRTQAQDGDRGIAHVEVRVPPARELPQTPIRAPAAGLEEQDVDRTLSRVAASLQGTTGVLVIGPEALESRAGLEELVRRAPEMVIKRMVFFAVGAAWANRLKALNPKVQVIENEDIVGLGATLMAMPEADRVTVLGGAIHLVQQLRQMVPPSMAVAYLEVEAAFRFILAALGTPDAVLDQVDSAGLEEQLARQQAA